jgi:hypothetical protein
MGYPQYTVRVLRNVNLWSMRARAVGNYNRRVGWKGKAIPVTGCGGPYKQTNSRALVRQRTIPTERPPLFGEVSANFSG